MNGTGTGIGKEVRVIQPMSTGETEYRSAEGVLVSTTMPGEFWNLLLVTSIPVMSVDRT